MFLLHFNIDILINKMLSLINLFKCLLILTCKSLANDRLDFVFLFILVFLGSHIRAASINSENSNELNTDALHDALDELFGNDQDGFAGREEYRRASLRYHPHIVYKKASLKPIIGQNGKLIFAK